VLIEDAVEQLVVGRLAARGVLEERVGDEVRCADLLGDQEVASVEQPLEQVSSQSSIRVDSAAISTGSELASIALGGTFHTSLNHSTKRSTSGGPNSGGPRPSMWRMIATESATTVPSSSTSTGTSGWPLTSSTGERSA
jgi:hypothetical protein